MSNALVTAALAFVLSTAAYRLAVTGLTLV